MQSNKTKRGPLYWLLSLCDTDSFLPYYQDDCIGFNYGAEVIIGLATINQTLVAIYAQDPHINRGYVSVKGAKKITRIQDIARDKKLPLIALLASPGISFDDELASGAAYTEVIRKHIELDGIIPQIALIMGPVLGAPAYSALLMDIIIFSKHRSYLMVTGPGVVKKAIGEKTNLTELGGALMHAKTTGIADFITDSAICQLKLTKELLDYFTHDKAPRKKPKSISPQKALPSIPKDPIVPFDMMALLDAICDESKLHLYKHEFGQSMICAFTKIDGHRVGVIANQSIRQSGAIDCDASEKTSRFIKLCDQFGLPIITFIDVPGFMPGKRQEQKGLLKFGAALCKAMQTKVPRLSVIVRKCYGAAAFLLMQTSMQKGSLSLALDSAQPGIMGKDALASVIKNDDDAPEEKLLSDPLQHAFELGLIDQIIEPCNIRLHLSQHLTYLSTLK
jgi:acetyl-CoA carboxylase carboxyltransferase component